MMITNLFKIKSEKKKQNLNSSLYREKAERAGEASRGKR